MLFPLKLSRKSVSRVRLFAIVLCWAIWLGTVYLLARGEIYHSSVVLFALGVAIYVAANALVVIDEK